MTTIAEEGPTGIENGKKRASETRPFYCPPRETASPEGMVIRNKNGSFAYLVSTENESLTTFGTKRLYALLT